MTFINKIIKLISITVIYAIPLSIDKIYSEAIETFGCITKANRLLHNIDKEHYLDACVIASNGK